MQLRDRKLRVIALYLAVSGNHRRVCGPRLANCSFGGRVKKSDSGHLQNIDVAAIDCAIEGVAQILKQVARGSLADIPTKQCYDLFLVLFCPTVQCT